MFWNRRPDAGGLLGVTISDAGCAAALVQRRARRAPQLVYCAYSDLHASDAAHGQWLRELARQPEIRKASVAGTLVPGRYVMALVDLPGVPEAERSRAARWRVRELLGFDVDDAVIDTVSLPVDAHTDRAYVVAAHRDTVDELVSQFTAARLTTNSIGIPEFALRNLAAALSTDDSSVACVQFDGASALITVTRSETLCVARRFANPFASKAADRARRVAGVAWNSGPVFDALVLEIVRTLDYYESRFPFGPVASLLLVPFEGEAQLVADGLEDALELSCRVAQFDALFGGDTGFDPTTMARCATAIGAALRIPERPL